MSAPRPFVTDPFHPLYDKTYEAISINIWSFISFFFHVVRDVCLGNELYLTIAHAVLKKHSAEGYSEAKWSVWVGN